ncbi:MAG TPA: hypothetical protein P5124_09270 [Syntrophorhabdaceae bacterium]|nr:hypothetical protein [Syntrophorhabdaceae bacterium]
MTENMYVLEKADVEAEKQFTSDERLGDKALKVLKEMEELWEMDHNNVELRDRFHLLRYYLERAFG